jgi:Na+-transporting NADH:ubiquinone oxidoreductase subunit NqrE
MRVIPLISIRFVNSTCTFYFQYKLLAMKTLKTIFLPIVLSALWISISEFVRNEILLKSFWLEHYQSLGLVFPSEPVNGAIWGGSLALATSIYIISRRFSLWPAIFITWFMAFVLMWLVIGNMDVLPLGLLWVALPLSILEVTVAAIIRASSESRIQQISKSREVHDKNCNGDPC